MSETSSRQCSKGGWPVLLATGFGFGYSKFAPGTVGALVGIPIVVACHLAPLPWSALITVLVSVVLFYGGVWLSFRGAEHFAVKDPQPVVIDEIASLPITFLLIPRMDVWVLLVGFVLNRIMDIIKPPPARQLEHMRGGWGIMLDDPFAGIYSCGLLHLLYWTVWRGGLQWSQSWPLTCWPGA